jgi:tetratricopeptide (TPR) repeat protein
LVLSARTSIHDVLVDRLFETIQASAIIDLPIDELREEELSWLADYFSQYGIWGERAAWASDQKLNYLRGVCKGQWQGILIKLFESPQILSRLETIFDDIRTRRNYYEVLLTFLILSVLGHPPGLNSIVDLCGQRVLEAGFKRDSAINEIVDFGSGEIRLRSAVAAEFVLTRIADPNTTVEMVISLARVTSKLANASPQYFDLSKKLAQFSIVQHLFPTQSRAKAIFRYYEAIKDLPNFKSNPLFWLQYAIACLVEGEFDRAEKYFGVAYSFAEQRQTYDSFQIDNHYARFLLMRAINNGDASQCMVAFRSARKILYEQMHNERLHYPYRVASAIGEFYDAFHRAVSKEHKDEIVRTAKYIIERIEKLPEERQGHRDVIHCWDAMQRILQLERASE